MTVVVSGIALACSPVSAAMAAMITLTDVEPYNFSMVEVLSVTIPAAVIGIIITGLVMMRWGKELEDDPEYQARLADGRLHATPRAADIELTYTKQGRNAAYIFLLGVITIVIFGLFPGIRPTVPGAEPGTTEPIGVTPIIQMVMFTVAALILLICKPNMKEVPESSVFKAGIVSAIALFGLAWLTDTFIGEWETADRRHRRRMGQRLQARVLLRRVPRRRPDDEPVDGDPNDRPDRSRRRALTRR